MYCNSTVIVCTAVILNLADVVIHSKYVETVNGFDSMLSHTASLYVFTYRIIVYFVARGRTISYSHAHHTNTKLKQTTCELRREIINTTHVVHAPCSLGNSACLLFLSTVILTIKPVAA